MYATYAYSSFTVGYSNNDYDTEAATGADKILILGFIVHCK